MGDAEIRVERERPRLWVSVGRAAAEAGRLPGVCLVTGEPTAELVTMGARPRVFRWWMLLVGFGPIGLVGVLIYCRVVGAERAVPVRLPMTARGARVTRLHTAVMWSVVVIGLLGWSLVPSTLLIVHVDRELRREPGFLDVGGLFAAYVAVAAVAAVVSALAWTRPARPRLLDDRVVIANVSRRWADLTAAAHRW